MFANTSFSIRPANSMKFMMFCFESQDEHVVCALNVTMNARLHDLQGFHQVMPTVPEFTNSHNPGFHAWELWDAAHLSDEHLFRVFCECVHRARELLK